MSYIFDVAGETVWSPSLRLGQIFVDMVESFAALVGQESGVSAMAEDYYEIDAEVFARFIAALLSDPSAGHPVYGAIVRSFVLPSMVIVMRSGGALPSQLIDDDLKSSAEILASSMPDL